MIVPASETYSDESDDEIEEIDIYRRKYQLLLERCEVLQQDNERIVNRIQQVKKLLRKSRRERKFLMDRLDRYNDNWRNAPLPVELDEPIDPPPMPTISHERTVVISKPSKASASSSSDKTSSRKPSAPTTPTTKRKSTKTPVDPNAPKRPANPFFQFCQEQRSIVLEQVINSGQKEPSKQELTKQLASRWNSLTTDDKKIYYDMYEKSKERYTVDMHLYSMNKGKSV